MLAEEEQNPDVEDWKENLNPNSIEILENCYIEPFIEGAELEDKFQFIRNGYFTVDNKYATKDKLVNNRIVAMKDTWKKKNK